MSASTTPSSSAASSFHSAVSDLAVVLHGAVDDDGIDGSDNNDDKDDDVHVDDGSGNGMDDDAQHILRVDDEDDDTGDDADDDAEEDIELDDDADANADVSMDDSEVDLTLLQAELAAATYPLDHGRAVDMEAGAVTAAAVATPTKPRNGQAQAQKEEEAKAVGSQMAVQKAQNKKQQQKDKGGKKEAAGVSPAKSLGTQGTMYVSSASDDESDGSYCSYRYGEDDDDHDDDAFHENGYEYGYTDVEAGVGGGKETNPNSKNKSSKKKTTGSKNKGGGGGCCNRCPMRCKVLGVVAFLAVMAGAIAYLFLGGKDGGPIWMASSASSAAANQASASPVRDGGEGTLGVISTYGDEEDGENDDQRDGAPTPDLGEEGTVSTVPAGCTDDGTWRLMRRDTGTGTNTNTNPGGFVLSPDDGCAFVAQHPSRHCGKSGLAWVVDAGMASQGSIAATQQVTVRASAACPVSCGTCDEYLEAKEAAAAAAAAAAALVGETRSPTASPTLGPTANPTMRIAADPTLAPTAAPTVPMKVEREEDEFYYDWDAVIAGATYDCPDPETILGDDLFDSRVEAGKVDTRLGEASGLASSRIHPRVLYTHEDYKDLNEFYAIDADSGDIIGDFVLVGATNRDYEDMAVGPGPVEGASYVYVGDVGDNWEKRLDIKIYRVKESLLRIGAGVRQEITDFDTLTLTYHDGDAHNSEAFYFDPVDQLIYIIRKEGGKMWRTPTKWGPGDATMTLVRDIDIGSNPNQIISGADMSPDGREVLLKYYGAVRYYCRKPGQSMMDVLSTAEPIPLPYTREPRGEAVAFATNRNEGYYTLSENNGDNKEQPLYNYQRIVDGGSRVQNQGKQQKEEKGKR